MKLLNISDHTNPNLISQINDGGTVGDLFIVDNLIYVTDLTEGLEILEINGLDRLREASGYSFLIVIPAFVVLFSFKRIRKKSNLPN